MEKVIATSWVEGFTNLGLELKVCLIVECAAAATTLNQFFMRINEKSRRQCDNQPKNTNNIPTCCKGWKYS
jgi:hypothetical protein